MDADHAVQVATALKKVIPSVVKREELFITSKLWNCSHQPAEVPKDLEITLKELEVDYLDLYRMYRVYQMNLSNSFLGSDALARGICSWKGVNTTKPP